MARGKFSFGPKATAADPWKFKSGDITHVTANGRGFECDREGQRIEDEDGKHCGRSIVNDAVVYVVKRVMPTPAFMHSWRDKDTKEMVVVDPEPVYMIQVIPDHDLQPRLNERLHYPLGGYFLVCEKALKQTDGDRKLMESGTFDFKAQKTDRSRLKAHKEKIQVEEMRNKGGGHRADDR